MIAGLVVHLTSEAESAERVVNAVAAHPALESGPLHGSRLPLVAEAVDAEAMHALTDWLADRPGVCHVDVAFADVEPVGSHDTTPVAKESK